MSKNISIDDDIVFFLDADAEVKKDEQGRREESYGAQIKRMLKVK